MRKGRRDQVREKLLDRARSDARVEGAAVTGSGASGAEDEWSDVDLFFGVVDVTVRGVLAEFTAWMYDDLAALHHFDLTSGAAIYRAFFLEGALEVDLGFAPMGEFRSHGGAPFHVVLGDARPASPPANVDAEHIAGLVWHHVMHARSSIERGKPWQAEFWISAVRDHVITLACRRLGYPTSYAKGADLLPDPLREALECSLVRGLGQAELGQALVAVTRAAVRELEADAWPTLDVLRRPLLDLAEGRDLPGR